MGRMKAIWGENCSKFQPERWISKQGKIKHEPSYKFLAFNAGRRTCLGKEIAFTQMKMIAATLIHNFHFQVVEDDNIYPDVSVMFHIKHGFKVKIYKRWA
ncbi:hypothetical protein BVRB_6g139250 [Beta vulgaris subsp. vulgaris]|nr:hypothetical protein BVRB_6g139250 [Beta vulgaris subsp. vulgaris]